jgi:L-cysteine S-thiosulfotransferase
MIPESLRTTESCSRNRARTLRWSKGVHAIALFAVAGFAAAADPSPETTVAYHVVGDGIAEPFAAGDPARGRALLAARDRANCVLCHAVPDAGIPFAGDVGPPLAGVGARLSTSQLRLRVVDNLRVNPQTIMPSYYKVAGLERVAPAFRGKPILTASQVEDVVAYLATLR